jgi:hypothetical protein
MRNPFASTMTTITNTGMSRRAFLRNSALAAVGAALAANAINPKVLLASSGGPGFSPALAATQSAAQDLDILQYALTLEHLESAAYRAINASTLLSGDAAKYFKSFGAHEATHVSTLTDVIKSLGGTPVQELAKYAWPTLTNQQDVLTFFQGVEELGAAAYLAQAPRLQNPDLLTAAVSIHNVEAQHAAVLSDLIGVPPSPAFGTPKSMEEVLMVVTPILMPEGVMPAAMPKTGAGGSQRGFSATRF